MLLPSELLPLNEYLTTNGYGSVFSIREQTCVVSEVSDTNYGIVYEVDNGLLVYAKHKAIAINKNKPTPKVCSTIQKTFKVVNNLDGFRKTNMTEILILEMQEEKCLA